MVPARLLLSVLTVSVLLFCTGCGLFGAKKKIQVPQLLTPLREAGKEQLIQEINRFSTVESIHGKVDIQFEDTSFASFGIADQYRLVDGESRCNDLARSISSFSSPLLTSRRWRLTANTSASQC